MSWISKAENLLNKIDKSAAGVLQNEKNDVAAPAPVVIQIQSPQLPKVSSKNVLILSKSTPKKPTKNEFEDNRWETMSEKTASRRSSISSRHDTVIDKNEDQKSEHHMKESVSSASLNSFSVEKELAATKILVSELRSENNELKSELESLMEQTKANGDPEKVLELENICAVLTEEKRELAVM